MHDATHELPRRHVGDADVEHAARSDERVERLDHLLEVGRRIPDVGLVEVDVVGAETLQRGVDRLEQVLPRVASGVRPLAHGIAGLGGQNDLTPAGKLLDKPADRLLALAAGVEVAGVDEVDAGVERALDDRAAGGFVEHPFSPCRAADAHGAETEPGNLEVGSAECDVLHGAPVKVHEAGLPAANEHCPADSAGYTIIQQYQPE